MQIRGSFGVSQAVLATGWDGNGFVVPRSSESGSHHLSRVTAILNDDLEHVSTDLLIRILASLGYRVKVSVVRSDTAA